MGKNNYNPDIVSAPGETLIETLDALGISQSELARRIGRPVKTINEISRGKAAITPDTALQLERALGIAAEFWNAREAHFRASLASQAEAKHLASQLNWLDKLPVREMIKRNWIQLGASKLDTVRNALGFFGIAGPEQFNSVWLQPQAKFRKAKAFASKPEALAAWLRKGELEAQAIHCEPFDETRFREALSSIRRLTRLDDVGAALDKARALCCDAGVAFVIVPELPGARVSGATRWLTPNKAIVQLSLRYKRDDQFWFSFFHEAGHILLHGKRNTFIEGQDHEGPVEDQANRFAEDLLLPQGAYLHWAEIESHGPPYDDIQRFAELQGISDGIVVGRLQHDARLRPSEANHLKRPIKSLSPYVPAR